MIGIYKITSPKNKTYIGQSVDIKKRFSAYKRLKCEHQIRLYRSLKKYGVENHKFLIICECELSELNDLERHYQEKYNAIGVNGMNCRLTESSDKSGYCSEETKLKIKKNSIGTRIGRKHSEETKRKIGLAHIGNKHRLGKTMSIENKTKLSKRNLGNKHGLGRIASEDQKKAHSLFMKSNKYCINRIMSLETRDRIGAGNLGKKRTIECKRKLSLAKIKIIMDLHTGVFYFGVKEASEIYNIKPDALTKRLNGRVKNNTNLIYT